MEPAELPATAPWLYPALTVLVALVLAYRLALIHAAVSAVSRSRLRVMAEAGRRRAATLTALLSRRDTVQAAFRLGFNGSVVAAAAGAWWLANELPAAAPAGVAVVVLLGLCLGAELLPRLVASLRPETVALRQAGWIVATYRLLGPLARVVVREESSRDEADEEGAAESFRELVDTAPLRPTQRRRITEILEFPDRTAGEIMVPRPDMIAVAADAPLTEVAEVLVESGKSRLPVYIDSKDDIVGVVHARDVLAWLPAEGTANQVARRPLFVVETMRLDHLLRELRLQQSSVAIVVDEYGGTAGMVTVEDIIEEIVGEIHDETDTPELPFRTRSEGGWLVSGRAEIDEFAELIGVEIELDEGINTVGGLALSLSGDLPEPGEVLILETPTERLLLMVTELDGARVAEVAVVLQAAAEEGEEELADEETNLVLPADLPGALPLRRLRESARLEPQPTGGACLDDLFAFWPPAHRAGRVVRWHAHQCRVVSEAPDGALTVRAEPLF